MNKCVVVFGDYITYEEFDDYDSAVEFVETLEEKAVIVVASGDNLVVTVEDFT
jgi:hypothetical protein